MASAVPVGPTGAPRVPTSRIAALLWFPFFLPVAFSLLALFAYAAPVPHEVPVEVVGTSATATALSQTLQRVDIGGFVVRSVATVDGGAADLRTRIAEGVLVPGPMSDQLLVAPASSAVRANALVATFSRLVSPVPLQRVDVVPNAPGDTSGTGLLFVALPLLLTGLISALVLLQFAVWSIPRKAAVLAATGGFATVFVYLLARQLDAIPQDGWILLWGFALTQVTGWVATGAAAFVKQFFLPFAFTFVLVLQLPSVGATVPRDMMPAVLRFLNSVMPLAQFVALARASGYFQGHGLLGPLLTMSAWLIVAAGLMTAAAMLARRQQRASDQEAREDAEQLARASVSGDTARAAAPHGRVLNTSDQPIAGAALVLLSADDGALARTTTNSDGRYRFDAVPVGVHHLLVSAAHCEPVTATVAVFSNPRDDRGRDFTLIDWDDPAANLAAEDVSERNLLHADHRRRAISV